MRSLSQQEKKWLTINEFIQLNPGLIRDDLDELLELTDNSGKHIIPHLSIAGRVRILYDAIVSLEKFAYRNSSNDQILNFLDSTKTDTTIASINKRANAPNNYIEKQLKSVCHTEEFTHLQAVKPSTLLNHPDSLKDALQQFEYGHKPKVIGGYKGMSIKASSKEKTVQLRENNKSPYFKLISYPINHIYSDGDIATLTKAHQRFRSRLDANSPWQDRNFLLYGAYREIRTFRELIEFYKECANSVSNINRIQKRYFSGSWGDKLVKNYCVESFRTDYLDRPVVGRQPSDRNEIIKITSAAINKAKEQMNIRFDVQPLIRKGERSRSDDTDKAIPKMSTLADFIMEAYQLSQDRAGLSMVIQFLASTRAKRTNYQRWERVKLDNNFIEVPSPESKTTFVRHPIPQRLIDILKTEKLQQSNDHRLTKDSHKQPLLMFESEFNRGKPLTKFRDYFNEIKGSLINKAIERGATEEEIDEIKRFQQHRIRDIVEQLLLDVHASEAQKEKCIGRKPSELGSSYGDLSIDKLSKLKDKMVTKIEREHPELKALFQSLIDKAERW